MEPTYKELYSVRFKLQSDVDTLRSSVFELHHSEDAKKRKIEGNTGHGVFGSVEANQRCTHCGGDVQYCSGHSGHISLSQPVFKPTVLHLVPKILTCVCVNCSASLITPNHPKYKAISNISSPIERLKVLYKFALKVRTCGLFELEEGPSPKNVDEALSFGYCGSAQPLKFIRDQLLVRPVIELDSLPESPQDLPVFTYDDCFQMLRDASAETSVLLGFGTLDAPSLHCIMTYNFYVPSLLTRPSIYNKDDDLSIRIKNIQKANVPSTDISLLKYSSRHLYNNVSVFRIPGEITFVSDGALFFDEEIAYSSSNNISDNRDMRRSKRGRRSRHLASREEVVPVYLDDLFSLQREIGGFFSVKMATKLERDFGRELNGIRERFMGGTNNKRRGRMRDNVMGKRGNMTARAVLSCDTQQDIDEIGLPKRIAMKLHFKEVVNRYNIVKMRSLVDNGPTIYPGANFVSRGGKVHSLQYLFNPQIEIGDVVYRHLLPGDLVTMNRQPSIHRYSIMAYRIRIHDGPTIKIHLNITTPIGGDFDGDEVNVYGLETYEAKAEALSIMSVSENMVKDNVFLLGFVQHAVLGAYKMQATKLIEECLLNDLMNVCGHEDMFELLLVLKNPCSGPEVLQQMFKLPNVPQKTDKKILNTWAFNLWRVQGKQDTLKLLSAISRVLERFVCFVTSSISFADCCVGVPTEMLKNVDKALEWVDEGKGDEKTRCDILTEARSYLGSYVCAYYSEQSGNGLYDIVTSGAKGKVSNLIQNSACVGQQYNNDGQRQSLQSHNVCDTKARGFIRSSFSAGLDSIELFHHLGASRDGLTKTSVSTGECGYIARKIAKGMEDIKIGFNGKVLDVYGNLYDVNYGGDGFDNDGLLMVPLPLLDPEVILEDTLPLEEHAYLTKLGNQLVKMCVYKKNIYTVAEAILVPSPLNFQHHLQVAKEKLGSEETSGVVSTLLEIFYCVKQSAPKNCGPFFYALWMYEFRSSVLVGYLGSDLVTVVKFLQYMQSTIESKKIEHGTPIGLRAGDSVTAPLTQDQLNAFHEAGYISLLSTGIPRMKELINFSATKTPSMSLVFFDLPDNILQFHFRDAIDHYYALCVPKRDEQDEKLQEWRALYQMDRPMATLVIMIKPGFVLSVAEICAKLVTWVKEKEKLQDLPSLLRFDWNNVDSKWLAIDLPPGCMLMKMVRETPILELKVLQVYEKLLVLFKDCLLCGTKGITDSADLGVNDIRRSHITVNEAGKLQASKLPIMITLGANVMEIFSRPDVDLTRCSTNDVPEVLRLFGIEAACNVLANELSSVMLKCASMSAKRHIDLIALVMCWTGAVIPFSFSGMQASQQVPLKMASFERVMDSFISLATSGHFDPLLGSSESCLFGKKIALGSNDCQSSVVGDMCHLVRDLAIDNTMAFREDNFGIRLKTPIEWQTGGNFEELVPPKSFIHKNS